MITLKVDLNNLDMKVIRTAADALRRGDLVVFPTETVYGLAADALNAAAVKKVFEAKGRYDKQPLPVQVPSLQDVGQAVEYVPEGARSLGQLYWPGPLTIVMKRNASLPKNVTGGGETVGIRVPDHPVALALLKEFGGPMVATSANASGNAPATNAVDAIREVGESVAVVLDCGDSRIGQASTVVDVTVSPAKVLRRGSIAASDIRKVLGELEE